MKLVYMRCYLDSLPVPERKGCWCVELWWTYLFISSNLARRCIFAVPKDPGQRWTSLTNDQVITVINKLVLAL